MKDDLNIETSDTKESSSKGFVIYKQNKTPVLDSPIINKKIINLFIGFVVLIGVLFLIYFLYIKVAAYPPQNVTLNYWGLWEDDMIFNEIISDFEKKHPNIQINYKKQDIVHLGNYIDRIKARINNKDIESPDILRIHNSWLIQLKDLLLPLPKDVVDLGINSEKYYEVIKKDMNYKGAYYGIPLQIDTLSLFVNKKIFESYGIKNYPTTWDDLAKVSRQLTVKDENGIIKTSGVALGTYDNITNAPDIISLLFLQNGANLENLGDVNHKKNAEDVLSFYISFAKGDDKVWDASLNNSRIAFSQESLAMFFGYSHDVVEIKLLNPNLDFEVISVPYLLSRDKTIASYWVESVSSKSKNPKEAFEFLKYLSQKDTLEKLFANQKKVRGIGEAYPLKEMASLLDDDKYLHSIVLQAKNSSSTIFSSGTYDDGLNTSVNDYLAYVVKAVLNDELLVEKAINVLSEGVNQTMIKYSQ